MRNWQVINAALLTRNGVFTDDDGQTKFCKGVGNKPEVLDLLYASSVWTYAQHLLGKGCVKRVNGGQYHLLGRVLTWSSPAAFVERCFGNLPFAGQKLTCVI